MTPNRPVGAYGFAFTGVEAGLLVPIPDGADWPKVHIVAENSENVTRSDRTIITSHTAEVPLVDGSWVVLDRAEGKATVMGGSAASDEVLHPLLATAAVVFSWWHGRNAFHGGAFAAPRGGAAWALLGERGAGKSSTLGAMAAAGLDIVADDLLVVADRKAFAGPRLLDLRPDTAIELEATGAPVVRAGARHRLELAQVPAELQLEGWVFLTWGAHRSLRRLSPAEWLGRATAHLNTVTTGAPSLLDLAGAEAWELTRPRELASLEPAVDELRSLVGG